MNRVTPIQVTFLCISLLGHCVHRLHDLRLTSHPVKNNFITRKCIKTKLQLIITLNSFFYEKVPKNYKYLKSSNMVNKETAFKLRLQMSINIQDDLWERRSKLSPPIACM